MSKTYKKHDYADRLKYMRLLESGYSVNYVSTHYGIDQKQLIKLQYLYKSEGIFGLKKRLNVRADYAFKVRVVRDIEENHLTLVEASLKYHASASAIKTWQRLARERGYAALALIRPRGRPPKNDMGRPRKKRPEEMTELERLRYENECLKAENTLLKKVKALVEEREVRLREIGRQPSKN